MLKKYSGINYGTDFGQKQRKKKSETSIWSNSGRPTSNKANRTAARAAPTDQRPKERPKDDQKEKDYHLIATWVHVDNYTRRPNTIYVKIIEMDFSSSIFL